MADLGQALSWDSEITAESNNYITLAPGEYDFTIESIEKQQFDGSEKMAPCPMAKVNVKIQTPEGEAKLSTNLFLNTKAEWRLSQFFECIRLKKHGEPLRPQWNLGGWTGRCKVTNREYNGEKYNELKSFLPPKKEEKKESFSGFGNR